jgi:hypothetical protein
LNEFTERAPKNKKQLFNLRHSSLRTAIEQGFGILRVVLDQLMKNLFGLMKHK